MCVFSPAGGSVFKECLWSRAVYHMAVSLDELLHAVPQRSSEM